MNRLFQQFLNEAYRLYSRPAAIRRERARWFAKDTDAAGPRVFYGHERMPSRSEALSGGLVKCQDLQARHPNTIEAPNLLYLVSSALPLHADVMARFARASGAGIVWNQNGVAYPAWHGRGWKRANAPLAALHAIADQVFYQSAFCQRGAELYLSRCAGPSEVLHNPVDTEQFTPSPTVPSLDRPIILVAGSHHVSYRLERAVDTLQLLLACHPGAILMVAGHCRWRSTEAECQSEIRAHAKRLGVEDHLLFCGPYAQSEAPALFHRAHVLLHTQYNDACPRLVVEAMACGVPVAYSATGGTPELVGKEAGIGIAGPLDWEHEHPPAPAELATAVQQILARYSDYRTAARHRACTHLSLTPWLDRHTAVFQDLAARPRIP